MRKILLASVAVVLAVILVQQLLAPTTLQTKMGYLDHPVLLSPDEAGQVLAEFAGAETKLLQICTPQTNPCPDWPILTYPYAAVFPGDATVAVYDDPRGGAVWLAVDDRMYEVHPTARQPNGSNVWTLVFRLTSVSIESERNHILFVEDRETRILVRYGNGLHRILTYTRP